MCTDALADALQAQLDPGLRPAGGGETLADEDGPHAVLHGHAPPDQPLPGGDQGPPLPGRRGRDRDGGQLTQGEERGQAQGVVAVGLALGVLELPGLAGGVGDVAG